MLISSMRIGATVALDFECSTPSDTAEDYYPERDLCLHRCLLYSWLHRPVLTAPAAPLDPEK